MAQSKKRRSSMSPARAHQPADVPDYKKRKPNGIVSSGTASSSKPLSASRVPPPPPASDSSTTLDGDSPSSPLSKDKGKAVEKDPLILELERLRKEVAHKNEILDKREKTLAAVTQTLSCQICLDLLDKPYALAPCGHVSCHSCLVAWFTVSHNNLPGHAPAANAVGPPANANDHGPAHAPGDAPPEQVDPPPVAADANGNPGPAANGPNPAPAQAAHPNVVGLPKTCPHCRCVVKERPVPVYALKDLVGVIDPPQEQTKNGSKKDVDKNKEKERDPWKGIFPLPKGPRPGHPGGGHRDDDDDSDSDYDSDDGPEFGGVHGNFAGMHPDPFFHDPEQDDAGAQEMDLPIPFGYMWNPVHHLHAHQAHPNEDPAFDAEEVLPGLPPPFVDEEDGVRRCGACLHELWRGECTNDNCGAVYEDASGAGSEEGRGRSRSRSREGGSEAPSYDLPYIGEPDMVDEDGVAWGFRDPDDEDGNPEEDDGYESSFIDDEGERGRHRRRGADSEVEDADGSDVVEVPAEEDDFVPGPSRRWARGREEAIVISSDEEGSDSGPSTRARRGRTRQILDEDEEEEELQVESDVGSVGDGNSALDHLHVEIHFHEHDSNSVASDTRSANPSVSLDDDGEDDDFNGYVPYVWEEEEDENEGNGDPDDVIYPPNQDGDEDDRDGYGF